MDVSLDAAIELEEVLQGTRSGSPTFEELVVLLKEPKLTYSGGGSLSMLSDVRSFPLLRDAFQEQRSVKIFDRDELRKYISTYLEELVEGIRENHRDRVAEAKRFCLALNENFAQKSHDDLMDRQAKRPRQNNENVD